MSIRTRGGGESNDSNFLEESANAEINTKAIETGLGTTVIAFLLLMGAFEALNVAAGNAINIPEEWAIPALLAINIPEIMVAKAIAFSIGFDAQDARSKK